MSYQVLARKWRPNSFAELVGQEHVVTAISNALDNNRLHHAYLFTGTRGVGKTTIARIFSKSLNCETGMSASPCGKCDTCREIEQGNYVDLLEIDAASRTKVEDTRELLDNVQYKPTRGEYKVYLIDEVHMLSKHSFNALLKTLEEPPPHVKFLLATTDPQKLPVTILSRCLQFNLKALSRSQISEQLSHILGEEKLEFEAEAIAQLSRAAMGSMRDALSLTDQAIAQGNGVVSSSIVTQMLGLMDKGQVLKLVFAIINKDANSVMEQVEQLSYQAPDYGQLLAEILSLLHQVALTQFVPDACKLETISARATYQIAKTITAEQVQLLYQIALQGKKDLPFAADGRSGLEMTLLRMLAFQPSGLSLDTNDLNQRQNTSSSLRIDTSAAEALVEDNNNIDSHSSAQQHTDAEMQADNQLEQLTEQQNTIFEEASKLVPPPQENHQVTSENYSTPLPEQETSFSSDEQQQNSYESESEPLQRAENIDESELPQPSKTESLLALKMKLQASSEQEQEQPSSVKKSEEEEESELQDDSVSTLGVPFDVPQDNHPEPDEGNSILQQASIDDASSKVTSTSIYQPPKVEKLIEPSTKGEEIKLAPPWNVDAEIVEDIPQFAGQKAQIVEELESFDPNAHLDEDINVEVDFEVPAFLSSGDKVVAAKQLDTWSQLIEQMDVTALTKQLALHSAYSKQENVVTLSLLESKQHLNTESACIQLQQALSNALQQDIKLEVVLSQPINTPFAVQQAIGQVRLKHAEHVVDSDPAIVELRNMFSASVVENSVKPR